LIFSTGEEDLQIKNYMKKDFLSVPPHAGLREVAEVFYRSCESIIPVAGDDGTFLGVISIDDFLIIFLPEYLDLVQDIDFIHDFGALEKTSFSVEELLFVAEDLMRHDFPVIDENDSLMKAAAMLIKHGIPRIPVLSCGQLVGMISKNDICRAIYDTEGLK